MNALLYRLQSEARHGLRGFAAIVLLVGIVGGAAIGALAGARSTDSAYPNFLRESHAADALVSVEEVGDGVIPFLNRAEHLPQVVDYARGAYAFLVTVDKAGRPNQYSSILGQPLVSVDGRLFHHIDAQKVIRGRLANPGRPDEITVSYPIAQKFGAHVGQVVHVTSWTEPSALELIGDNSEYVPPDGPSFTLRIVGEVVAPGELAPAGFDNAPVHFTPAFFAKYHGQLATALSTRVRLRSGAADMPAFRRAVDRLAQGRGRLNFEDQSGQTAKIQRSVHLQSLSLRVFALLAAIAGALIVGQVLSRQLFVAGEEHAFLRGIGMSRTQLVVLSMARAAVVAVLGAALAVVVALAASSFAPIGLARVVAPSGLHPDGLVLAGGAAVVVVTVLVLAAFPAWRRARRVSLASATATLTGGSRMAERLARAGFSPSAVAGTRFALEPGVGRSAVPVRSTLLSGTLAVAGLSAALSFGAGLNHLLATPRLYGWDWDVMVGNPYAGDLRELVLPVLAKDRNIARYAYASSASVTVDGRAVTAASVTQVRGRLGFPLVRGRAPQRDNEVSIGPKTLRFINRKVGDTVIVAGSDGRRRVRIVGSAVFGNLGISDLGGVGEGLEMTPTALSAVAHGSTPNEFFAGVAHGRAPVAVVAELNKKVARGQVNAIVPARPADLENYTAVRNVPLLLSGVVALTAVITLTHTLVASVRRRRRDLASLKTLGFVQRQVRAAIAWQATILIGAALVVGLPAGVAAGEWAWRLYAIQQGVVPEPAVPYLLLGLVVPGMLIAANVIAAVPATSAARTRPALVLRAD